MKRRSNHVGCSLLADRSQMGLVDTDLEEERPGVTAVAVREEPDKWFNLLLSGWICVSFVALWVLVLGLIAGGVVVVLLSSSTDEGCYSYDRSNCSSWSLTPGRDGWRCSPASAGLDGSCNNSTCVCKNPRGNLSCLEGYPPSTCPKNANVAWIRGIICLAFGIIGFTIVFGATLSVVFKIYRKHE